MCISLALAATSVVIGAASAGMSMVTANANRDAETFRLKQQSRQLREQSEVERIAADQQEAVKFGEFESMRSAALAAIGASGVGEHISFFQGADPEQRRAFGRDVSSLRLNLGETQSRIGDQIKINDLGGSMARYNAKATKIGAMGDFLQTSMDAANFYTKVRTPAKAG
jgi:hypothetical protein